MFFPLIILIAIAISLLGVWVCFKKPSWYNENNLSFLMSLSTGVLLAVLFLEFLPHVYERGTHFSYILVCVGVLFIIFSELYLSRIKFINNLFTTSKSGKHIHHGLISHGQACCSISCFFLCGFFDGIEIKTAFSLGSEQGLLTLFSLLVHIFPDGVVVASLALSANLGKKVAVFASFLMGFVIVLGATVSHFLEKVLGLYSVLLPLVSGVLIYLCLAHLIPVSLKHKYGFLVLFLTFGLFSFFFTLH